MSLLRQAGAFAKALSGDWSDRWYWREPGAVIGQCRLPGAHVVLGGEAEWVSRGGRELGDAVLLLEPVVALLVHTGAFTLRSATASEVFLIYVSIHYSSLGCCDAWIFLQIDNRSYKPYRKDERRLRLAAPESIHVFMILLMLIWNWHQTQIFELWQKCNIGVDTWPLVCIGKLIGNTLNVDNLRFIDSSIN